MVPCRARSRWYHPLGVAFDGANIWVTNSDSNNVTKLRASDGKVLGTFGVGSSPYGVAFDGANVWVANGNSNNVTKLRATASCWGPLPSVSPRSAWPLTEPTSG